MQPGQAVEAFVVGVGLSDLLAYRRGLLVQADEALEALVVGVVGAGDEADA